VIHDDENGEIDEEDFDDPPSDDDDKKKSMLTKHYIIQVSGAAGVDLIDNFNGWMTKIWMC